MSADGKLQVGDTLYYTPRYGIPTTVTVTKVGRLWAECGPRLSVSANLHKAGCYPAKADRKGYVSPGNAYRSEEAYNLTLRPGKLRSAIATAITAWAAPRTFTLEQLEAAAKALGIEVTP